MSDWQHRAQKLLAGRKARPYLSDPQYRRLATIACDVSPTTSVEAASLKRIGLQRGGPSARA
jgi:hypothetical protein